MPNYAKKRFDQRNSFGDFSFSFISTENPSKWLSLLAMPSLTAGVKNLGRPCCTVPTFQPITERQDGGGRGGGYWWGCHSRKYIRWKRQTSWKLFHKCIFRIAARNFRIKAVKSLLVAIVKKSMPSCNTASNQLKPQWLIWVMPSTMVTV